MAASEHCSEREQRQENKQTMQQSAASGAVLFRQNKFFDEGLGSDRRLRIDNGVVQNHLIEPLRDGAVDERKSARRSGLQRALTAAISEFVFPKTAATSVAHDPRCSAITVLRKCAIARSTTDSCASARQI